MLRPFKLLTGENDNDDIFHTDETGTGWVWASPDMYEHLRYEVVSELYLGIDEFMNEFPDGFIVMVRSIIGPRNIVRNYNNQSDPVEGGWGFDIENDWLAIDWIRLLP